MSNSSIPSTKKYCPIIKPIKIIGDEWTLLIIRCLLKGARRFNAIKEEIPEITSRTLTARLKFLVEADILERKQYPEIPPRVEYKLTEMGEDLKHLIACIEDFGNKWLC